MLTCIKVYTQIYNKTPEDFVDIEKLILKFKYYTYDSIYIRDCLGQEVGKGIDHKESQVNFLGR